MGRIWFLGMPMRTRTTSCLKQCAILAVACAAVSCQQTSEKSTAENASVEASDASDALEAGATERFAANGSDVIAPMIPSSDVTFAPMTGKAADRLDYQRDAS